MAISTTDTLVHPEDGWVQVGTAVASFLAIGSSDAKANIYLAFGASAPAASLVGLTIRCFEVPFWIQGSLGTPNVYVRVGNGAANNSPVRISVVAV